MDSIRLGEKMRKDAKSHFENQKVFIIMFLMLYMAFSAFLNKSFTSDHVSAFVSNDTFLYHSPIYYLAGGRFTAWLTSLFAMVLNKIHISIYENQFIVQLLLICMLAYSLSMLYSIFMKYVQDKRWLYISLFVMFYNPYFIESFVYKAYEWGFGIILSIWAVKLFIKKKYVFSSIVLFFAISTYQSFFSLYLIFLTGYLYLNYEGNLTRECIVEFIKMVFITGITAIANILIIRLSLEIGLIESTVKSVSKGIGLFDRLQRIIWAYYYTTGKCFGMLPKWSLLLIIIIISLAILIALVRKKASFNSVLFLIMVIGIINIAPVSVIGIAEKVGAVQRVVWPIFSALSVSLIILCNYYHKTKCGGFKIITLILCFAFFMNMYFVKTCIVDYYCSNKMDEQMVMQIQGEIEKYEKGTNTEITKVATYRIGKSQYYYENLNLSYQKATYSHKMMYDEWSDVELINYVTGNTYEEVEINKGIIEKYFKGKSWNTYIPEEQLVFVGDTLYWAIY